jgi:hypothetical protein
MLQCSIYLKILYTPRGVCDIKRQGGCFPEPTLLCPEMQETGKFSCTSLCKAELAESQTVFGGWGSLGENKPLKVLGFLYHFGTISHGLCLPIFPSSQFINSVNKRRFK